MRTLAIANQKGGVGKSTLAVHVAYAAIEAGLRVLLVDLDRQGSLSISFPPAEGAPEALTASALFEAGVSALAPAQVSDKLAIVRADELLARVMGDNIEVARRPATALRRFAGDYDLCVIDTPGVIGFNPPMTLAALMASDAVVCPCSVGLYESKGLADLWAFLKNVKSQGHNPRLRLMGMLASKVNTRSSDEREALEELRRVFGPVMLPGLLAERVAVKQAIMRRRPVWRGTKGAGHQAAAAEWRAACTHILGQLGEVA